MYGILVSAFKWVLGYVISGVTIKFVLLTGLYYVITWIADTLLSQLDISPLTGLQTVLNAIPSGVLWFLGHMRADIGVPLVLGAYLTSFLIRRLPVIG